MTAAEKGRRAATALLTMTAVVALLGACGTDASTTETATTRTAHPDTSSDEAPAFPDDTAPQSRRSSGKAGLVLTHVRDARHEGFDRIVLEFSGTGTPGWSVNYVEKAVLDGSGEAVTLAGDTVLDIYASDTTWPAPDYYRGPSRLDPQNGGKVREVYVAGTFEGYTQVLAGIDGAAVPFRVFALADPARLVVDVVNDSDG